jgi:hypothetical protein
MTAPTDPDVPVAAVEPDEDGSDAPLPTGDEYASPYAADAPTEQDNDQDPPDPAPLDTEDTAEPGQRFLGLSVGKTASALLHTVTGLVGTSYPPGYCLNFVRTMCGAPAGVVDATTAWRLARDKHLQGTPPAGAIVYWIGGSHGHGHIAVSKGGGYVVSTDYPRGKVGVAPISFFHRVWGLTYAGWAWDVNGVRVQQDEVHGKPPAPAPATVVSLRNVAPGKRNADVADLQRALRAAGYKRFNPSGVTGFYGNETRRMVLELQRARRLGGRKGIADRAVVQALRLRAVA